MPGQFIGEVLLRVIAEAVFYGIGYGTGLVVENFLRRIPAIDRWFTRHPPRRRSRLSRWLGRTPEGDRFERTVAIGLLFWLIVAAVIFALIRFWPDTNVAAQDGAAP